MPRLDRHPSADRAARLRGLLQASRPLSWVNTALPFLAAAVEVERGLTPVIVLATLYFLVPFNLLMYGANDIFDYASDLANPRKRSLEGGLVPPDRRTETWLAIAVTNIPVLLALALVAPTAGLLTILAAAATALAYSSPPVRTKERPFLDSLTSASHFVLPVAAGFLVAGRAVPDLPWLALAGFVGWAVASHALGAIQDIEYDRAAGIGSVATAIGARRTAVLSLGGYASAVLAATAHGGLAVPAAAVLTVYLVLPLAVYASPVEAQARRAWRSFLGANLIVGFLLTQLLLRHWGIVTAPLAEVVGVTAVALAAAPLLQLIANEALLRRSRRQALARRSTGPLPRLSVVVPCRDEADRLAALVAALAAQDHPDLEVLVVDDGSTDGSADVVRRELATRRPGQADLDRVIAGARPSGWAGKSAACALGASLATGGHVLFLDADTVPAPTALRTLHAVALRTRAGLVSGVTRYAMPTATEGACVPGFPMVLFGLLPIWASVLAGGRSRRLAFAYGPLLLVERSAYETSGGHGAVPASQREDLDLARTIAGSGRAVRLIAAADLATTRHYPGGTGALAAWRRVGLAYGGDAFPTILLLVAVEVGAWLLPFGATIAGLVLAEPPLAAGGAVATALVVAFRVGLAVIRATSWSAIFWHPVTVVLTVGAQLASLVDGILGRRPIWRGRSYEPEA